MLSRFLTVAHSQLTTLNLQVFDSYFFFARKWYFIEIFFKQSYTLQVFGAGTYYFNLFSWKKNNLCMIVHFWNWLTLRISICTYKLGILGEGDHRMSNRSIYFTSNWSPNRSKLLKKLIKSWLIKLGCPDCECCFF